MSTRLRDLIKSVRSVKTAAEERAIITKESALIRTAFKEEIPEYRERNVAKLLYIHMLGYPTHFGQMECIKLLASNRFADKRIGYLALMLLLDEKQETLMLVTNSLQQDLNSSNPFAVGLALTSIGNICGAEMARDLAGDIEKALKSTNPYVRKKAALAAIRMLRKVPDLIEQFLPVMVQLLLDKSHAVLLTGVALVQAVVETEPRFADKLQKLVPALVKILRRLISAGVNPEYDVGGVTDPFLQSRILCLLRVLGRTNTGAAESMNSVLAQVASQTDTARNAGNAVLYEVVNTIMSSEHSEEGLRVLAVNILGKFLGNTKDNNIRYVALSTLCRVVHRDVSAVQRHRTVIVECLRDGDVSIRNRALELAYALVNEDNVRAMTREMLSYLAAADVAAKADVCTKVAAVTEKFSPSVRWHVDTLISMLATAGNYAKKEVLSALVFHITHASSDTQASMVHKLFTMAGASVAGAIEAQQLLLQVAVWCIGEYGHHLKAAPPAPASAPSIPGLGPGIALSDDVTGPYGEKRTEGDIARLLERIRLLYYVSAETTGIVMVAALKLTTRLSEPIVLERLRKLMSAYGTASDVELQTRSVEFGVITGAHSGVVPGASAIASASARSELLAAMPMLEESVLRLRSAAATGETATDASRLGGDEQTMAVAARGTVTPSLGGGAASKSTSTHADLDDLFGGMGLGSAPAPAPAPAGGKRSAVGGGGDLDDLFGMGAGMGAPAPSPALVPAARPAPSPSPAPANANALSSALDSLYAEQSGAGMGMGGSRTGTSGVLGGAGLVKASSGAGTGASAGLDDLFGMGSGLGGGVQAAPAPVQPAFDPFAATAASPAARAPMAAAVGVVPRLGGMLTPATPLPASASSASTDPFASLVGRGGGVGASTGMGMGALVSPAPSQSAPLSYPSFVAYESSAGHGLHVAFAVTKPSGAGSGLTDLMASFSCKGPSSLTSFTCQVAVPKTMKLTLLPASSSTVPASGGGVVTQLFKIDNSQHGEKAVAVRLKLVYTPAGAAAAVTEQVDVKNFPQGV